ncbi:polyprotein [Marine RNA virus PAL438]|uniref:polyprotein n=1 Tax=Marine RNA virus PAL438 TaxID=1804155 RepID=UPI0007754565|nr:polyprotein [Marine RNA virus PAL438]AMK49158.1 polyprotein [Marine RNA virus PAL438]
MKVVRDQIGENVLAIVLDLFTTLFNMYKSPSWDSIVINMTSFVTRNFDIRFTSMVMKWFEDLFSFASVQADVWKDTVLRLFDLSNDFIKDRLWTNINEFFVKIALVYGATVDLIAFETFDVKTVMEKFVKFQKNLPEARDLIAMCFDAYQFVFSHWKEICTGQWQVLFLGKDEAEIFEIEVRVLEQAFPLVINAQVIELKTIYNMSLQDYESRLVDALKVAKSLIVRCTSVQQRMSVSNFVRSLTEKQGALQARIADAPTREEPYSIKLSGSSSCGKSTLINLLSKTILNAYGFEPDKPGQTVFTNIEERYESTIEPHHKIICADDVGNNAKGTPNYDRLLNYNNVVPRPLEKAGVEEKGEKYPGNIALMVTTNDETLRAKELSVCPESILRRFGLDIVVEIREKYRNAFGGLIAMDEMNYSVYRLTLKRFSRIEECGTIAWDVLPRSSWNPFKDDEHDLHALLKFLVGDVKKHIVHQKAKTKAHQLLAEGGFCGDCSCPKVVCMCEPKEPVAECQFRFGTQWAGYNTGELWDLRTVYAGMSLRTTNLTRRVLFYRSLWSERHNFYKLFCSAIGSMLIGCFLSKTAAQFSLLHVVAFAFYKHHTILKAIDEEIAERRDSLSSLCDSFRTHTENNAKKYFAVAGVMFTLYGFYRTLKPFFQVQDKTTYFDNVSNLFDSNIDYPRDERFKVVTQDQRDYREGYSRLPPKITRKSATTTSENLQESVARSLRHVITFTEGKQFLTVNGIMISGNVLMVPAHVIPGTFPFDIETSSTPGTPSAKTKDQKIGEDSCYIDREHDVAFVHLASSPASNSFKEFFPEEYPTFYSRSTVLLWKSPKGEVLKSLQASRMTTEDLDYYGFQEIPGRFYGTKSALTKLTVSKGEGLKSTLEFKGFPGLCGAMYIDRDKGILYGMHVAGYNGSPVGFGTCITQPLIRKALAKLDQTSPTLVTHSLGDVSVDTYGAPFTLHNVKPHYTRDDGTQAETIVTYLGEVHRDGRPLENRARTPYIPTPFVGVTEEFGVSKHKPPTKVNDIKKSMKTLNKLTTPVQHYEGDILARAINDFRDQTVQVIKDHPEDCQDMLRIYSQEEALDGIGEFGLGGLPNDTSAGFPINKSKKRCLKKDPMDESLTQIPREFSDDYDIQTEIDATLESWSNGERSEPIFKASSKVNELLPNAKADEKVRKFYGSPMANLVASRRVLAGVPRFMRKYWKETECMVGINATSKEWEEFHDHLVEFGENTMIAGDFSGFDTRMAAQITGGASKIILDWYKAAGCTEEELMWVRGALSDIIHPNILFDGQLFRFANANPSGNFITVQLNGVCNSIMMRYVYYAMMPQIKEKFSQNVRLGTYGDDNAMSVKKRCGWYTHTSCQEQFERLDIGYTMADKDAVSRAYIGIGEISFLKRGFAHHPDLNKIVAPIEEDSSLKKFYYIKKPNDTPLTASEQFAAHAEGSFRDRYLHGREAYEDFTRRIKSIISQNESLKGRVSLIPYDEMTVILSADYAPTYVNDNKKLFSESFGVSEEEFYYETLDDDMSVPSLEGC